MVLSMEDLALQDFINGHSLDREATQLLLGSLLDGFNFLKYISIRFQIIIGFGYLFVYQAKCLKLFILTLIETRLHLILGQVGMSSGLLLREINFYVITSSWEIAYLCSYLCFGYGSCNVLEIL